MLRRTCCSPGDQHVDASCGERDAPQSVEIDPSPSEKGDPDPFVDELENVIRHTDQTILTETAFASAGRPVAPMATAHGAGLMLLSVAHPLCLEGPGNKLTSCGFLVIGLAVIGVHTTARPFIIFRACLGEVTHTLAVDPAGRAEMAGFKPAMK